MVRNVSLKAHCRVADWANKTIKMISQASVISIHIENHEDDNALTPFSSKIKHEHKDFVITERPDLLLVASS